MKIHDIKCSKSSKGQDILDYGKINNIPLIFPTTETMTEMINGDIIEKKVTIKYFHYKVHVEKNEYPIELITINSRKKKEIENSNEPIFITGILKYNPIKEKFVLISFKKIELFLDIHTWIYIISQLSFDEVINELLAGLNMNSSKLVLKEKNMFLARLIPLVQNHYLLIDFSKRATRKTRTYLDLGYHIPAAYNFTRAKIIYDQSQHKQGLIFRAISHCLILDEYQNNNDIGISMGIQQYSDDGTISDDKGNVMQLNTSVVILGNPKIPIEYPYIFTKWQNIFEGTTISKKNTSTGDAFLSRFDYFIPSWGSRIIKKEMILDDNIERIPTYILRSVFKQLREIDISHKVKAIINTFNFKTARYDSRSQKAIEKTFEGLIKLLLPLLTISNDYRKYQKELRYLYNLALEGRIITNNMLQKIKPENIPANLCFSTALYFNKEKNVFILPHRKVTIRENEITKEALDSIGILQNEEEIKVLKEKKIKCQGDNLYFKHSYPLPNLFKNIFLSEVKDKCQKNKIVILGTCAAVIGTLTIGYAIKKGKIKSVLQGIGGISALGILKKDKKKIIKALFNNKQNDNKDVNINLWSDNIFFNYLLGENETTIYSKKDIDFLKSISFYRIGK